MGLSFELIREHVMDIIATAPTLDSMEGDAEALVEDFFTALAADHPGDPDASTMLAIGKELVQKYKLRRLGKMFRMPRNRALEVVEAEGGDEALLVAIELNAGFSFASQTVPASALLAGAAGARVSGETTRRVQRDRKVPTISDELLAEGTLADETIPESCYAIIETDYSLGVAIEKKEQTEFTDALLEKYFERFFRFNLGRPLCRHLGKQIEKKLKLANNGSVDSKDRRWWKILYEKSRNRKQVRMLNSTPLPRTRPRLRLLPTTKRRPFRTESVQISASDRPECCWRGLS